MLKEKDYFRSITNRIRLYLIKYVNNCIKDIEKTEIQTINSRKQIEVIHETIVTEIKRTGQSHFTKVVA